MNQPHSTATDAIAASNWHGTLELTFANQQNATQLVHSRVQAPLKIQRPFYPEGVDVCHSVILHTAGGVVGGDRLSLNLELQPGAHALITTAAAGKIYRSNGQDAQQTIHVNLAPHARLEWLPQETIVFNQARYHQTMRIELAPGAHWLGWEITRFGRTARGEKFVAGEWRSHTEVWQQGRPLWLDRQWLPGSEATFSSLHGLAGYPIVGSFAYLGQPVEADLVEKIRSLWSGEGDAGVTRLQTGFLCRYRGESTTDVRQWFTAVWGLARSLYFQRPICPPRVWL